MTSLGSYQPQLLFNILQHLSTLETFEFSGVDLKVDTVVYMEIRITKSTNIKALTLSTGSDEGDMLRKPNRIIKIVLEACPLLEKLKARGEYRFGPGPLTFDLGNHKRLKVYLDLWTMV